MTTCAGHDSTRHHWVSDNMCSIGFTGIPALLQLGRHWWTLTTAFWPLDSLGGAAAQDFNATSFPFRNQNPKPIVTGKKNKHNDVLTILSVFIQQCVCVFLGFISNSLCACVCACVYTVTPNRRLPSCKEILAGHSSVKKTRSHLV